MNATAEKLGSAPWSLEQIKGQRLEGNEYAIEIDADSPDTLLLFARKNNEWVCITDILMFDSLHICGDITFPLTKEEYEILSKSKISVDKFVEDLAGFDADIPGEFYEPDRYLFEEDINAVFAYLSDADNKPFDGQNLSDDAQVILADVLDDTDKKSFQDRLIERNDLHQRLLREEIVKLIKAGQLGFDFATEEMEDTYAKELSPTYRSVYASIIGERTEEELRDADKRTNELLQSIRDQIIKS